MKEYVIFRINNNGTEYYHDGAWSPKNDYLYYNLTKALVALQLAATSSNNFDFLALVKNHELQGEELVALVRGSS